MMKNQLALAALVALAMLVIGYFYLSGASLVPVVDKARQSPAYQEFLTAYPNATFYQVGAGNEAILTLSSGAAQLALDFSLRAQGWKLTRTNFTCSSREVQASTTYGFDSNASASEEVANAIKSRPCT